MTQQQKQWEADLLAAGWTPTTAHDRCPIWRDPQGQIHPELGWSWLVMKKQEATK